MTPVPGPAATDGEGQNIRAVIRRYERALTRGDASTAVSLFTGYPVCLPEHGQPVCGTDVALWCRHRVTQPRESGNRTLSEIAANGDLAVAVMTSPDAPHTGRATQPVLFVLARTGRRWEILAIGTA